MNGLLHLEFQGFPANYCYPADPGTLASDIFSLTTVTFAVTGSLYYNYSESVPGVDQRIYPWVRKYGKGVWDWNPDAGGWVKEHPVPPSSQVRILWEGTDVELQTYDGGDTDPLGDYAGPMWEIDTNYAGRSPMGPGAVGTETLDVAENMGAISVALTNSQLQHTHVFGNYSGTNDDARFLVGDEGTFDGTNSMEVHGDTGNPQESEITQGNLRTQKAEVTTGAEAVPIVHPVRGVYLIKRTSRIGYKTL